LNIFASAGLSGNSQSYTFNISLTGIDLIGSRSCQTRMDVIFSLKALVEEYTWLY